ncbi:MAG TPA: tRNA pseudouridine(55) synthase TruB [Candidatus Saccharimonadales bacterium]|nr:tRNA pseudouridine(55) synthase TruB [Candidatus Saccharimonadales bacterium]
MTTKPPPTDLSGLLLIDKPAGITSFDIIRALRRQTGVRKIGHAGTLDPSATGLMLMLIGAATKQATQFSKLDKTYLAEMTLGATSTTGDREGELSAISSHKPTQQELEAALRRFEGEITQTPSQYSAIKVGGVRAYKLARAGKSVEMPPRQVTVHSIKLIDYAYPLVRFEATVSSGTYIRTLAEDIGTALGTGAYLSTLRRVGVGEFTISQAHALDSIDAASLAAAILHI